MADFTDYPELVRAIKNTKYIDNPYASDGFHPAKTPEDYAPTSDDAHALKVFAELVRNITDMDYGDFMRKANGYLCHLKSQLKNAPTPVQKKLDEMQRYTQFAPSGRFKFSGGMRREPCGAGFLEKRDGMEAENALP